MRNHELHSRRRRNHKHSVFSVFSVFSHESPGRRRLIQNNLCETLCPLCLRGETVYFVGFVVSGGEEVGFCHFEDSEAYAGVKPCMAVAEAYERVHWIADV